VKRLFRCSHPSDHQGWMPRYRVTIPPPSAATCKFKPMAKWNAPPELTRGANHEPLDPWAVREHALRTIAGIQPTALSLGNVVVATEGGAPWLKPYGCGRMSAVRDPVAAGWFGLTADA